MADPYTSPWDPNVGTGEPPLHYDTAPYAPPDPPVASPPQAYPPPHQPAYGGYPPPPAYGYPGSYGYPQQPEGFSGISIGGFVTGLVGLLLFWLPILGAALAIVGVALSAVGMKRPAGRGLAIAGLVCGIVGALFGLWLTFVVFNPGSPGY